MKIFLGAFFILVVTNCLAQSSYEDSIGSYVKKYVNQHEVVIGKDKELMSFFPVNEKYRIHCRFERTPESPWFRMESSGPVKRNYRIYGILYFTINDTAMTLNIYQSQDLMTTVKYRDHLFIPFTDATSGEETYESGRYLDLEVSDIVDNRFMIDFNKAYNPYCAYISGKFNCPIPPAGNRLSLAIRAGEKSFKKTH